MPKKHEFTTDEINYIITNWGKESVHSMKKRFKCSWYAISKLAESYGLEIPTSNEWTKEEIETLKDLSDKIHYKEIAALMGKSENAIYLKARKLGIVLIQSRRTWTYEEEIEFKELWGNASLEYIAKKLKRSIFSLKVKAIRMHLGPMVKNAFDIITISDITELTGVSRGRIVDTWTKLGLELKQKKLTKNMTYYVIELNDLLQFLEDNQNEWDSRNVEPYALGNEPDWLIQKRKRDKIENPLWYRKWTKEEIRQAIFLFRCHKSYSEIAEQLERSEGAVTILLRDSGYSYRLPQFWKGQELKFLKDNYQNMTYSAIGQKLQRSEKAVSAKANELGYLKRTRKKKN